jgi:hypothetical protein
LQLPKFSTVFPALLLAACHQPPIPPPAAIEPPVLVRSGQGVDLATDSSDVLNELQASGLNFVARYYREPDSRWPPLSAGEAQRLSALGLKIVAVWESHSRTPAHFSYAPGYSDALTAYSQAKAIGQPIGSAIYFAVDFNVQEPYFALIDDYFRGVGAGLAAASGGISDYAVGVYGSGAVCYAEKRAGLAQYSWLSNSIAWTGSTSYDDWNIRQGARLETLSFNHDADEARDEYGAFQLTGSPIPMPFGGIGVIAPPAPQQGQFASVVAPR